MERISSPLYELGCLNIKEKKTLYAFGKLWQKGGVKIITKERKVVVVSIHANNGGYFWRALSFVLFCNFCFKQGLIYKGRATESVPHMASEIHLNGIHLPIWAPRTPFPFSFSAFFGPSFSDPFLILTFASQFLFLTL